MGDSPIDKCTICLENIGEDDRVKTKCGHSFHFTCVYKNIKKNSNSGHKCPLCREVFIKSKRIIPRPVNTIFSNRRRFYRSAFAPLNILNRNRRENTIDPSTSYRYGGLSTGTSITRGSIRRYINVLSFSELKTSLELHNLSTRGYRRITLERRLQRGLERLNLLFSERGGDDSVVNDLTVE